MKKLLASFIMLFAFILGAFSATVNITYRYVYNGNVWFTETKAATVGEAYPELHAQPQGVKYTTVPFGTVSAAETFNVNCELTGESPVKFFSADYASAQWVFLSVYNPTSDKQYHLKYVANQNYITVDTGQNARPDTGTAYYAYQWAFVGNPIAGFSIVNRQAGSSKILVSAAPSSTNSGGDTFPIMMDEGSVNTNTYNKTWNFHEIYYGFLLSRSGESTYLNNRNGKLSFWTSYDYGSLFTVAPVDMTMTAPTLDTTKQYMLVNKFTGKALADKIVDSNHVAYPIAPDATDHYGIWTLEKNGDYYRFKNYGQSENGYNYYINATQTNQPNSYVGMTTTASSGNFYVRQATDNGYYYLLTSIAATSGTEDRVALADNNGQYTTFGGAFGNAMEWELREVNPVTVTSSITSGNYYRLVNRAYTGRAMTDTGGKVAGMIVNRDAYNQVWKITKSGSTYAFQNALTGKYIQMNPGTSTQFSTNTTARYFTSHTTTADGTTYFAFDSGNNGYNAFHCASSQSYNVVGWTYSNIDASYWMLENVTLTSEDLANIEATRAIANGSGTDYTTQLSNFFSDYACTTLKSNYASMTDAQLRSAMSALPSDLQEMAVRVKNDTWNSDAVFNHYEKDFRIHEYEIYSNGSSSYWGGKTGIGPFAHLFNPTGIQAKAGDIVYIFVDNNVKDSYATLEVECVTGTNRSGSTKTLTQGYNALYVNADCELFISYLLNSTTRYCTDYPDIKIHIEGATCNGCFDMHRGHTNNDWMWLSNNMFQGKYLHAKGNSVLLNLVADLVRDADNPTGIMKIWDFIFDTEQSFAGCDQWKNSGQYKMMINSFHNEDGGYPHWGSGNGTSHPNLTSSGCFNYNSLANGGLWEVAHEIGHGHQNPIKLAGTDESSNNVMSQIIQFLPKDHITDGLFQSAYATRNNGVKKMTERFNEGWAWFDYLRDRMDSNSNVAGGDDNISNRWLFQLWMYFDYLGNYQPTGGNNGFAFISALYDKLRANGIGTSQSVAAQNDYLLMAKYCAEITQTNLDEFFEAWGFWRTRPYYYPLTITSADGSGTQNTDTDGKYQVGGYSSRNITVNSTTTSQITTIRNQMKGYTKKGSQIMFIEDRGVGCTIATTVDGMSTNTMGDHGYYGDYTKTITGTYSYTVDPGTNIVTMAGGENAVGFKIYDGSGNLVAISNMDTFSVPAAVATGLAAGTYSLVAVQGDGTDIATTGEATEPTQPTEPSLYCIQSWRSYGFVKYNSDSEGITQTLDFSDANTKFYFLPVNGTNWNDGVKIVSNVSGKQLVDVGTGFADSGTIWYIKENPYKAGFYCISKTIDLSSGCWDCNASGAMTASYWQPSANDNDGTSWQIVSADSLPQFQTSTLAEPKWYYIQSGRDNRYLYANGTSAGTSTSNGKTDAYKFAFIATANNGIQVISKVGLDQGSNQYLTTTPGLSSTAATWYYYNAAQSNGYFMLAIEELEQNGYAKDYFGYLIGSTWAQRLLHVDASGNLTKWNGSGVGNLYKVEEAPEDAFEVTYNVIVNGNVVATGTQIHSVGDQPSMPAGMDYAFTTFTFNVSEITASTRTVQATATFNMPFETSTNYATAKWYYMNGHASYSDRYISTDGDATVYSQGKGITDAYQWAFIGNPIDGIKVINKAAGDGKYLQGTNPATMGTTAMTWVLKQQTNTSWQCGANGFGLYDATLTYLNTQGTTLKYWGSFDQGSTFWVEEVPEDYAANVEAEIKPWFETYGGYFQLKSSVVEANQSKYEAALVTCNLATYEELTNLITTIANFNYPETGRYRIKSSGSRIGTSYIGYGTPQDAGYGDGLITIAEANIFTEPTTIITLTRQGNTNTYTLGLINGLNVQNQTTADKSFPATADAGAVFTFVIQTPGVVAISSDLGAYSFLHESGVPTIPAVVKWTANAEASHWMVEDVAKDGDVNNDGFVNNYDLPLLINLLLNKPGSQRTDGSDANRDGVISLADVTKLVNILNEN